MRDEAVEFQWDVHEGGYRWIDTTTADAKSEPGTFLTNGRPLGARGYAVQRYNPLALYTGLFRVFTETEATPQGVKTFADKFGPLGGDAETEMILLNQKTRKGQLIGTGERLGAWHREILTMGQVVDLWEKARKGDAEGLAPFIQWDDKGVRYDSHPDLGPDDPKTPHLKTVAVIADEHVRDHLLERFRPGDVIQPALYYLQRVVNDRLKGRVSPRLLWNRDRSRLGLYVVPRSLVGALWLQFARAMERDSDFRKCVECGAWFELSPRTARADKVYCSNACRTKAYRKRQAKAARRGSPVSRSGGQG